MRSAEIQGKDLFTGIVKSVCSITKVTDKGSSIKIQIKKPYSPAFSAFSALKTGDSVAVDGVCLTLDKVSSETMGFHIGFETLKVTEWNKQKLENKKVNLEPALRALDFVGGHFVSGHVDGMAIVISRETQGECLLMEVKIPVNFRNYFWKKAFVSLNGVSLTVNEVKEDRLFFCLVPETLKRTNLADKVLGSFLTFEIDYLARALFKRG